MTLESLAKVALGGSLVGLSTVFFAKSVDRKYVIGVSVISALVLWPILRAVLLRNYDLSGHIILSAILGWGFWLALFLGLALRKAEPIPILLSQFSLIILNSAWLLLGDIKL